MRLDADGLKTTPAGQARRYTHNKKRNMLNFFKKRVSLNDRSEELKKNSLRLNRKKQKLKEIDLTNVEYISLPVSPPYWKEKENKYGKPDYTWLNNKINNEIYKAYYEKKYNKVITYYDQVKNTHLKKEAGQLILKAYRKIINRWKNKSNNKTAIKWSFEMCDRLPFLINDSDKKKHNKLISILDSSDIKYNYSKFEIEQTTKIQEPKFKISNTQTWFIKEINRMAPTERPDQALKEHFFLNEGVISIDKQGKVKNYETYKSVLSFIRTDGDRITKGLNHDIYRTYLNPIDNKIAFLSKDCILYSYKNDFSIESKVDLKDMKEVQKFTSYTSNLDEIKRYIRCIAVSPNSENLLFTIVDEAYYIDKEGNIIWSVKSPVKEGFTKFSNRITKATSSKGIQDALNFMELSYPISNDDVKERYRELAKKYHPDVNPNDLNAKSKFQRLLSSYQKILGAKPDDFYESQDYEISHYRDDSTYTKTEIPGLGTLEMGMVYGGLSGCDWIYAASFSNDTGNIFLGTYSGRILELDIYGQILRVYDIGSVPINIFEDKGKTYILTDTRLYILRERMLSVIVDIFDKGNLMFAENGFGLISKNKLRLYNDSGKNIFEVESKDPVRNFFIKDNNLVIETRQDRAKISKTSM
jgi:hypothetical protein